MYLILIILNYIIYNYNLLKIFFRIMECAICKNVENWEKKHEDNNLSNVKKKGIATICDISRSSYGDGLDTIIENEECIQVHEKCRVRYLKANIVTPDSKRRRLNDSLDNPEAEEKNYEFDFSKCCIICTKKINTYQDFCNLVNEDSKLSIVNYHTNNDTINSVIREIIINKLLCVDDIKLLNARYHNKTCSTIFREKNRKSIDDIEKNKKIKLSMEEIFNYIDENEDNEFTIEDFYNVLNERQIFLPSDKTIWNRLKNHFQDDIIIVQKKGAPAFCCLKKKDMKFCVKVKSNLSKILWTKNLWIKLQKFF